MISERRPVEWYRQFRDLLDQALTALDADANETQVLLATLDRLAQDAFELVVVDTDTGDEEGHPPQAQAQAIEDGIFNLVVSLVMQYSTTRPPAVARQQVAGYLERIIAGLAFDDSPSKEQ